MYTFYGNYYVYIYVYMVMGNYLSAFVCIYVYI